MLPDSKRYHRPSEGRTCDAHTRLVDSISKKRRQPRKNMVKNPEIPFDAHSGQGIIYLACPYSHPDYEIRVTRFRAVTEVAARLIEKGCIIFSPVTMTHPIDLVMAGDKETMGSDFWVEFDQAFMRACSSLVILTLPGWQESNGIKREMEFFIENKKDIYLIDNSDLLNIKKIAPMPSKKIA
jgi:Domain of unknown function (DUF1937)